MFSVSHGCIAVPEPILEAVHEIPAQRQELIMKDRIRIHRGVLNARAGIWNYEACQLS